MKQQSIHKRQNQSKAYNKQGLYGSSTRSTTWATDTLPAANFANAGVKAGDVDETFHLSACATKYVWIKTLSEKYF